MEEDPRGIRNRNPGNIRFNQRYVWLGQQSHDADGFVIFDTALHGLRAMGILLRHYAEYDGVNTVRQVIDRWDGRTDLSVADYIDYVANYCHVSANQVIKVIDYLVLLMDAIIQFENGENPYNPATVVHAVELSTTW